MVYSILRLAKQSLSMLLKRTIVLFWDGSINNSFYIYLPYYSIFNVFVLHHRLPFSLVNSSHSGRRYSVNPESLESRSQRNLPLHHALVQGRSPASQPHPSPYSVMSHQINTVSPYSAPLTSITLLPHPPPRPLRPH